MFKFSELCASDLAGPLKTKNDLMNIHFQDITCTVPLQQYKFWNKESKHILKNVSGDFQDSKLTAIIGPSGCGKTTLLDIISGYRIKGVSGYIYVNDMKRNIKKLIKRSCYIMQDDTLQHLVTVEEEMAFAVNLKLETNVTKEHKEILILKILKKCSLLGQKNKLIKNLSSAARRRLVLALELISNPPVLFLDEPTKGLDGKSTKKYFEILRKLSCEGRTVVCSVCQPSTSTLNFFHNAYVLSEGQCIYQGTVDNLITFLRANNFECPLHHNPIEYVMEICSSGNENYAKGLNETITNGKSQEWLDCPTCWSTIPLNTLNIKHIQHNQIEDRFQYPRSFQQQLYLLLKRMLLLSSRDRLLILFTIVTNIFVALLLGICFNAIGNDRAQMFVNHHNLLFLFLMEVMYSALVSRIITFSAELPVIKKEYLSGWYSLKTYFVASVLTDIPIQTFYIISFSWVIYHFIDQPLEVYRSVQFVMILVLWTLVFRDYGMCAATFLNTKYSILFAFYSTSPWVIFSGVFIHFRHIPLLFKWMFKVSIVRRALEALTIVMYGRIWNLSARPESVCFPPNCFLNDLDMDCDNFLFDFVFLLMSYVTVKFCCYFALKYKIFNPK